MKTKIHPQYFNESNVVCSCGNKFTIGSTQEVIHIQLCNKCHPFYTGDQRFIDTRSVIKDFEKKRKAAQLHKTQHADKVEKQKKQQEGPKTLREMLLTIK